METERKTDSTITTYLYWTLLITGLIFFKKWLKGNNYRSFHLSQTPENELSN